MTETSTMTLTEFLLSRIAADEELCRDRSGVPGWWISRMLSECEAKRQIVDDALRSEESIRRRKTPTTDAIDGHVMARRLVVRQLAAVYADHPDYRDEWRP